MTTRERRGAIARALLLSAALLAAGASSACTLPYGFIFTDVVEPLDVNLSQEPFDERKGHLPGRGDLKRFRYYHVEVGWGENGIGSIAQSLGWERVHYADQRTVVVLWYWWQTYVDLYGE